MNFNGLIVRTVLDLHYKVYEFIFFQGIHASMLLGTNVFEAQLLLDSGQILYEPKGINGNTMQNHFVLM